ncbi:nucleotidyltransferase family protein [Bacteroidota bacterium]
MKAMILAAGLGTRLRPLTNKMPKALVRIRDKTLLDIAINNLTKYCFNEIIINVHHFAEQIIHYLKENKYDAEIHISDESEKLLDTGGGLKKTARFFKDVNRFLIYNVDIISNLDLSDFIKHFDNSDNIASLVVRKRASSRYLMLNANNVLCGWKNVNTGEEIKSNRSENLSEFAFSGIHILSPEIFSLMPDKDRFSMIDLYLSIMNEKKVNGYLDNDSFWLDVGDPQKIITAEENYSKYIS